MTFLQQLWVFLCGALVGIAVIVALSFWRVARINAAPNSIANLQKEELELTRDALHRAVEALEAAILELQTLPNVRITARAMHHVTHVISHGRRVLAMPGCEPEKTDLSVEAGKTWPFDKDGKLDV